MEQRRLIALVQVWRGRSGGRFQCFVIPVMTVNGPPSMVVVWLSPGDMSE